MGTTRLDPTPVLVVDDQRAFAQSLEHVIDAQEDLCCVGTAATGEEALRCVERLRPAVVLMDVDLPDIDGIEVTRSIRAEHPDVDVVVLTGHRSAAFLFRAASAGACAFLLKDSSVSEIVEAVRACVCGGELHLDEAAMSELLAADGGPPAATELTPRELEVLDLLAQGRQPKQIARHLGITVQTCRGYVKSVLAKLEVHSALEAVVQAHRLGLISLPER